MAKKKKSGSKGIQAIKAKQRAKKLASRAKNRAIREAREIERYTPVVATAEKIIAKGYDEGFVYVGKYSTSMPMKQKIKMAKSGELNPMKIRQAQELGLHGNVGIGFRGKTTDTLLPSGIKRSQINKNRPEGVLLAERINKTFEDLPDLFAEGKVHTSQKRAVDLRNQLRLLQGKGLLVDTGRKVLGTNVYEQRIDMNALKDFYMNADEKEIEKIEYVITAINEGPEMSQMQYDYWRRNTEENAEALGTTGTTLEFADFTINTTGLFAAVAPQGKESEQAQEARSMDSYISNNEQYWDKDFKTRLEIVIAREDFDGALEMLKEKGYRPKYNN